MKKPLHLAITCFSSVGGSGMIAADIGLAMAARGHQVHVIARELPVRLQGERHSIRFHPVRESAYPVLHQAGTYPIALASKMVEVASLHPLDVLHVHYAVPHAAAAWMAREVLGRSAPRLVTTLHGTDSTVVGTDSSYLPITRFSILQSDAVTTPSAFLEHATRQGFGLPEGFPIHVLPNFVDTARFAPGRERAPLRSLFPRLGEEEPVLVHVSNFRPIKRVGDVVAVFAQVHRHRPCRLVMIGDGPERSSAEQQARELGLLERVAFLGKQEHFGPLLAACDVFLLPSEQESFGVAALEALSCGVPVVASDVGGLPELVEPGLAGLLVPVGDVGAMARAVLWLLEEPGRWREFSSRARARVLQHFRREPAVDRYEALYRALL
jgi:N-acetyl-alpha-D-glucosaminyl L-malate synthase BshA